ncbi:MAG: T9SS type A sorting domain-containing protein [Chitinophagaceae bacterium]
MGTVDFVVETVTGKGITAHTADLGQHLGDISVTSGTEIENDAWEYASSKGRGKDRIQRINKLDELERLKRIRDFLNKQDCPPDGGTKIRCRIGWDPIRKMWVLLAFDPNLITGPDGQPDKAWVSVNDRLPYTIEFENDSSATARARYVKITSPIEPKQDPTTLELGSFGFNNQSFDIPVGSAVYTNRLDTRDSTGVFVDITAGYDIVKHQIFWEFQAIDPVTLLPPDDPLAGFLFVKDSVQDMYGKGFVNFSIKPRSDAQTLDTIGARAFIVFDENDTIPTNIHKNTIDAVAPTSQVNTLTALGTSPINLSWTGSDDPNGSGIDYYTIYVTEDNVNYSVLFPKVYGTDTTFSLPPGVTYCFFVLATDRTGNAETLRTGVTTCTTIGNPLPVSLLYFTGTNVNKDNLLKWATASEQNSKEFRLERSLNGTDFTQIAVVPAAGNSATNREYNYTDRNIDLLNSTVMFYRLKQVDNDLNFKFSNIVRLNYLKDGSKPSIVYPNPTGGAITILIGDNKLIGTEASVSDINGRLLKKFKITATSQSVDLSTYVGGVYFIRLQNKETLKIVKQ